MSASVLPKYAMSGPSFLSSRHSRGATHVLELVLGGVNVPDKLGRACGLDRAIDLLASSGQDESAAVGPVPAVEPFEPLPRGHGLVDAARATIARAGPSDGFLDGANRLTLIESSQSLLNRSSSGGSYR